MKYTTWPQELPRFAEAFRIVIDHPTYANTRLLTSEWQTAAGAWPKMSGDTLPLLAKAGRIGVIVTTAPRNQNGYNAEEWYGESAYPEVFWHPDGIGGLRCVTSEEVIADWCKRRKVPRALFDVPASQEWCG
jgi:hypothetical protein